MLLEPNPNVPRHHAPLRTTWLPVVTWLLLALTASCGHQATGPGWQSSDTKDPIKTTLSASADRAVGEAVSLSALVIDADSGEVVWERSPSRLLHPASTQKLLTTLSIFHSPALPDTLPKGTRISVSAPAGGRMLLFGACDPKLSVEELEAMLKELQQQGVRDVIGPLLVVDPLFGERRFGKGWMWDDEPGSFMPHLTGVPINRGCVEVTVQGSNVSTLPTGHGLDVRIARTLAPKPSVSRNWQSGGNTINVQCVEAKGAPSFSRTLSVASPADMTASVLSELVFRIGLSSHRLPSSVVPPTSTKLPARLSTTLSTELKRPLFEVVERSQLPSDNLAAELLLRWLPALRGFAKNQQPASEKFSLEALSACIQAAGLNPKDYRIADGSGVSHYNLISAHLLVTFMQSLRENFPLRWEQFKSLLPISGSSGTLARRMRGTAAQGRVFAKTGTIGGVSNLSGIIETQGGRTLHFAFLVQNYVGSAKPWRALQDELCLQLVEGL